MPYNLYHLVQRIQQFLLNLMMHLMQQPVCPQVIPHLPRKVGRDLNVLQNWMQFLMKQPKNMVWMPNFLKSIAKCESDFDPACVSHSGATGIMQLMPATAAELGVSDSYDPYQEYNGRCPIHI